MPTRIREPNAAGIVGLTGTADADAVGTGESTTLLTCAPIPHQNTALRQ